MEVVEFFFILRTAVNISTLCVPNPHPVTIAESTHDIVLTNNIGYDNVMTKQISGYLFLCVFNDTISFSGPQPVTIAKSAQYRTSDSLVFDRIHSINALLINVSVI